MQAGAGGDVRAGGAGGGGPRPQGRQPGPHQGERLPLFPPPAAGMDAVLPTAIFSPPPEHNESPSTMKAGTKFPACVTLKMAARVELALLMVA